VLQSVAVYCEIMRINIPKSSKGDPWRDKCVLQCVAVCCSVLQCVADPCVYTYRRAFGQRATRGMANVACCSVLQCVAVCCSAMQIYVYKGTEEPKGRPMVLQMQQAEHPHTAEAPVVLQYVAVCCSALQCVAVCCSTLQCVVTHSCV